eukprot:scaffold803_cov310-Pinguiococcus_pyrenoidosus.AAC.18
MADGAIAVEVYANGDFESPATVRVDRHHCQTKEALQVRQGSPGMPQVGTGKKQRQTSIKRASPEVLSSVPSHCPLRGQEGTRQSCAAFSADGREIATCEVAFSSGIPSWEPCGPESDTELHGRSLFRKRERGSSLVTGRSCTLPGR